MEVPPAHSYPTRVHARIANKCPLHKDARKPIRAIDVLLMALACKPGKLPPVVFER
jgi:hypothetical protein